MDARRNAHALGKSLVCLLFSRGLGACLEMAARDWDWGLRARSAAAAPIQKTPGDLQMAGRLAMPSLRRCKGPEFLKPEEVDPRKEQGRTPFNSAFSDGARNGAGAAETGIGTFPGAASNVPLAWKSLLADMAAGSRQINMICNEGTSDYSRFFVRRKRRFHVPGVKTAALFQLPHVCSMMFRLPPFQMLQ